MTSFNFHHLFKDPISDYRHILKTWALGLQHVGVGGDTAQPIIGPH